jgi:DNA replication protein DnaC
MRAAFGVLSSTGAERERWSYRDFLTLLATEEIAHRQQTRLARLTRRAQSPFLKTIDDFNFTYQSSLRLQMLGSALTAGFVTEGRSLILAGKPGRGKTHVPIAIAYRAIQNGFDAFFTTAATLIDDLFAAFRAGELAQALPTYTQPAWLRLFSTTPHITPSRPFAIERTCYVCYATS